MLSQYIVTSVIPVIDLGPNKDIILGFYFAFLIIGGNAGLPLLITTLLVTKTVNRRHPTLINFLISWTVYGSTCLILLYAGKQGQEPPRFDICLAQASLFYGNISGGAVATLCLVLQLWLDIKGRKKFGNPRLTTGLLLIAPWAIFSFFTILALVVGIREPSLVTRKWVFYCTVSSNYIVFSASAVGLVVIALVLIFQGLIHHFLYKCRRTRAVDQSTFRLYIRVSIFTFFAVLFFVIDIVTVFVPTHPAVYIIFSLVPLSVFLGFGIHKENFRIWFRIPRRRDGRANSRHFTLSSSQSESADPSTATDKVDTDKSLPPVPRVHNDIHV
ncbi:hypothetical protein ACEPAG_8107 [Sanghuangporus baumii]